MILKNFELVRRANDIFAQKMWDWYFVRESCNRKRDANFIMVAGGSKARAKEAGGDKHDARVDAFSALSDYLKNAQTWVTGADSRVFLGCCVFFLCGVLVYFRYRARVEEERLKELKQTRKMYTYGITVTASLAVLLSVAAVLLSWRTKKSGGAGGGQAAAVGVASAGGEEDASSSSVIPGSIKSALTATASGGGGGGGGDGASAGGGGGSEGTVGPSPLITVPSRETVLFYLAIGVLVLICFMSKMRKKSKHHKDT